VSIPTAGLAAGLLTYPSGTEEEFCQSGRQARLARYADEVVDLAKESIRDIRQRPDVPPPRKRPWCPPLLIEPQAFPRPSAGAEPRSETVQALPVGFGESPAIQDLAIPQSDNAFLIRGKGRNCWARGRRVQETSRSMSKTTCSPAPRRC
jgi:hypothetical protein